MRKPRLKITDDTIERIKYLVSINKSRKEIAEDIGACIRTVENICNKNNICLKRDFKQPSLNENYFENIITEYQAYILGFLYADGYIDSAEKSAIINIHQKDIDILYKIKQYTNCKNDIHKSSTKNCVRLNLCSKKLVNDLKKFGVVKNKSKKIKLPNLNYNIYKHFFRGYCDGDGYVGKRQVIICTGSKQFYNDFTKYLSEKFKKSISTRKDCTECFYIVLSRKDVDIIKWMYEDSNIYINRKYQSYLENWSSYTEKRRSMG